MTLRRGSVIILGQFHFVVHSIVNSGGIELALVGNIQYTAQPDKWKWCRTSSLPEYEVAWIDLDKKSGQKNE